MSIASPNVSGVGLLYLRAVERTVRAAVRRVRVRARGGWELRSVWELSKDRLSGAAEVGDMCDFLCKR